MLTDEVFHGTWDIRVFYRHSGTVIQGYEEFLHHCIMMRGMSAGILKSKAKLPSGGLSTFMEFAVLSGVIASNCDDFIGHAFPITEELADTLHHCTFRGDK